MQLRLSLSADDPQPSGQPTPLASLYPPVDGVKRIAAMDRLRSELAQIEAQRTRIRRVRHALKRRQSKLDRRAEAVSFQLESLERNPLAIMRYQTTLSPEYCGDLWQYRPLCDLRLESVPGMGGETYKALVTCCPTIGDLEIVRVEEGLTSLPRIGELVAKRIEKKLLAWLARHAWGYVPSASYEHLGKSRDSGMPREIVI